jgi:hypothetical protein
LPRPAVSLKIATIWDLPFLSLDAKKAILGGNATRLFSIKPESA